MQKLSLDDLKTHESVLAVLKRGGIVIIPTDTVYGIACDAFLPASVEKLFEIKRRDPNKTIAWLCADLEMAKKYAHIAPEVEHGLGRLWPGVLTAVLPALGAEASIGLRVPRYPWLTDLIREFGRPIAVTSANISGEAPQSSIAQLLKDFGAGASIECIVDAGDLPAEAPSTVVDFTQKPYRVLRDGPVSRQDLKEAFGENF